MFVKFHKMSLRYVLILIVFLINKTVNVAINDTADVAMNAEENEMNNSTPSDIVNENRNNTYDSDSDDKYQLRRLHSTPSAEIFLEGCTNLYSSVSIQCKLMIRNYFIN